MKWTPEAVNIAPLLGANRIVTLSVANSGVVEASQRV